MRRKIREKLATVEFVENVGHIEVTREEATKIQQMIFDMDDLKEKMTKLALMINERCQKKEDEEIYNLAEEIYLQHLVSYEQEEYMEEQEDKKEETQEEDEEKGKIIG